jgi:hypothetical protein
MVVLEVGRMSERALWDASMELLDLIDFGSPSYDSTKVRHHADELRQVLLELRQRGSQLSLLPSAS